MTGCSPPRPASQLAIVSDLNPWCSEAEWVSADPGALPDSVSTHHATRGWEFDVTSDLHERPRIGDGVSVTRIGEWSSVQRLVVRSPADPGCPSEEQFRLIASATMSSDELSTDGASLVITIQPVGERQHLRAEAWDDEHTFMPSEALQQLVEEQARAELGAENSSIQAWVVGHGVGSALEEGMTHSLSALAETEGTVSFLVDLGPATVH